jgi:nucleotidyltransferase/DNA polymerase involved in DNA repair
VRCYTSSDLRRGDARCEFAAFRQSAAWYLGIANGEDDRPVAADRPRKSSGSETTFERDLTASPEIEAGVEAMADEVWAWCHKAKAFGRTVTVKVKFADFQQVTPSRSLSTAIARHDLLRQASVERVRTLLPTAKGVRLLGYPYRISIWRQPRPAMSCRCLAPAARSYDCAAAEERAAMRAGRGDWIRPICKVSARG